MNPETQPLADLKVYGFFSHREEKYPKDREWFASFSNWYPSDFELRESDDNEDDVKNPLIMFCNEEKNLMFMKARRYGDNETAALILKETDPAKLKRLGRAVKGYDDRDWRQVRYKIAVRGLKAKFEQNETLKLNLLRTGDKILAEASHVDSIWGIALRTTDPDTQDPVKWKGLNLLGKALMEVRDNLLVNQEGSKSDTKCRPFDIGLC